MFKTNFSGHSKFGGHKITLGGTAHECPRGYGPGTQQNIKMLHSSK